MYLRKFNSFNKTNHVDIENYQEINLSVNASAIVKDP